MSGSNRSRARRRKTWSARFRQGQLKLFFDLADSIHSSLDVNQVLQDIADHFAKSFSSAVIVVRPDPQNNSKLILCAFAGTGLRAADFLKFNPIPIGRGLLGRAAERMRKVEVNNIRTWHRSYGSEVDHQYNFGHSIAVPLTVRGSNNKPVLVGVIGLFKYGRHGSDRFRPEECKLLDLLGQNTANAIHNARLTEDLRRAAEEDALTGVFNRRVLFRSLKDYLNNSRARSGHFRPNLKGKKFSILYADANNLKLVNDLKSHAVGDRGLITVAHSLLAAANWVPGAKVARVGGDEFAVFLPDVDLAQTETVKQFFKREIEQRIRRDSELLATSFGASVDFVHFENGAKFSKEYHALLRLLSRRENSKASESAEEHDFLSSIILFAEEKMKQQKLLGRGEQFIYVPLLLKRLRSLHLPRRQRKQIFQLLAVLAGQTAARKK